MKQIIDLLKWLLEVDIRAKNATSVLLALLSVIAFFLLSRNTEWFRELAIYGTPGIGAAHMLMFGIVFLATWLVYSGAEACFKKFASNRRARLSALEEEQDARRQLEALTDFQKELLRSLTVETKTQIHAFEIGPFEVVWKPEVQVLVHKGILKHYRREDVYEIEPRYVEYLKQLCLPET